MPPETTPMMQQYLRMKELHPDCILFFRLGDFYEMFNEDAKLVSRELDLTLTTRDRNKPPEERTPMCGVPYHSADAYIARLIAKGYKVASASRWRTPPWPRAGGPGHHPHHHPRHGDDLLHAGGGAQQLHLRRVPGQRGHGAVLLRHLHRRVLRHLLHRAGGGRAPL